MKKHAPLTQEQISELSAFIGGAQDAKELRRAQTVLLLDRKEPLETITLLTKLKRRQIFKYRSYYLKTGLQALTNKRKGKPNCLLSKVQREEILEWLKETSPKEHGYESDFWSTSILGELIKEKYRVIYRSKKPFYLLFQEAKFTFHKPGKVYEKRDEAKVQAWKEEVKAELDKAFEDPQAVLLCEDEMVLSTQTTFQKVWLKQGEYPKIEVSNTKKNKSIYGFLNIKTGECHAFIKDWQNMYITIEVLKSLRNIYPSQKIFLFWDGAGWQRGSKVQEFIEADKNIKVIYFPPYSPEENPQEHVWKTGRANVSHNVFILDIEKAAVDFTHYLNTHNFPYNLLHLSALS